MNYEIIWSINTNSNAAGEAVLCLKLAVVPRSTIGHPIVGRHTSSCPRVNDIWRQNKHSQSWDNQHVRPKTDRREIVCEKERLIIWIMLHGTYDFVVTIDYFSIKVFSNYYQSWVKSLKIFTKFAIKWMALSHISSEEQFSWFLVQSFVCSEDGVKKNPKHCWYSGCTSAGQSLDSRVPRLSAWSIPRPGPELVRSAIGGDKLRH